VVLATGQQWFVDSGELGVVPQRRNDAVRHRNRADVAGLDGPHRGLRRTDHVRTRSVVGSRRRVQAVSDRCRHQLVVGRVVLDVVDAVAAAGRGCAGSAGCGRPAPPNGCAGCRPVCQARSPCRGPTARLGRSAPR
jgi:hypothetical protein